MNQRKHIRLRRTWHPAPQTICVWAIPLILLVASGQTPATRPAAKPGRGPALRKIPPRPRGVSPATRPAVKKSGGCGTKSAAPTPKPAQSGPHPHWVCAQPTITAEPVWKGERVKFAFKITNDGEADLKIKAKGG